MNQPLDYAAIRREAHELVLRLDPAVIFLVEKPGATAAYSWDGNTLVVTDRLDAMSIVADLHDISHFLLACPNRRHEPEFGLGEDPNRRSAAKRAVSPEAADIEEAHVCLLQMSIALALGIPTSVVFNVANSLNSPLPYESELIEIQEYQPTALSPEMWRRVINAVAGRELDALWERGHCGSWWRSSP